MINPPKALIFDLDGTLVDTAPDLIEQLQIVMTKRGVDIPEVNLRNFIGGGARPLIEKGFEEIGVKLNDELMTEIETDFLEGYEKNCTKNSAPFPFVIETLKQFANDKIPMVVCTNKRQQPAEKVLTGLGLAHFFTHIKGRMDGFPAKPEAATLEDISKKLSLKAEEMVMIGDSKTDIDFAHNCGMKVVAVSFGYSFEPIENLGADILIDSWKELPAALDRV